MATRHSGLMPLRVYGEGASGPARGAARPVVLHLHGGAFTGGSLDTGALIAEMLVAAGAVVVAAAYPCGPDHPFPAPLEAAYDALLWSFAARGTLASKTSRIYVAGAEAGGNLAAALAMMARDQQAPPLAGQILISPMLDPCLATPSLRMAEAGPVGCKWADGWHAYLGSADKAGHPYASPAAATRLGQLAPALVITSDDDPLRDEALAYATRLRAAGTAALTHVVPAPTGWPDTMEEDGTCPCVTALPPVIRAFFSQTRTGPAKRPAPSPTP
ncbi:alpha/beta hydrolase fold domain-containing protein [Aquabacter spiritensis]|uniref:alpha/beta hydrolase fold domain-containing protein n=1 Tax=Aquabacter spiritensis TaxID=933073 RepID=UPI001FE20796|nr:alpha/beta hydrolase [Aquabacter spiritensis]